jgi:lipopolysaccharide transport system permease protein
MVRRDFVAFYKQTIIGPLWFFIQPIFITITYVFVFGKLASIGTDGIPPTLFYLTGIACWSYISDTIIKTSTALKDNSNVFSKVYFPRLILPLSIVFSNFVKLGIHFILLFIVFLFYRYTNYKTNISLRIFNLPFFIIAMSLISLGIGLIISAITTKYRDLALLISFGLQLIMYATPIIYPLSSLNGKMKTLVSLNPYTFIIEGIRNSLFNSGSFHNIYFIFILIYTCIILLSGVIIFNKVEKNFVDTI